MRYLAASKMGAPGSNGTIVRFVLHATVSPCRAGQAWATALYFANPAAGGSAHYTGDPGEIVQSVPESRYAWHAPPNRGSLGWEMTDSMVGKDGRELPASRWGDANHDAMMRRVAAHMRTRADALDIPLRWLTVAQVRAGERGFCDHHDVSLAFGQTTHWDCGVGFHEYRDRFMEYVRGAAPPPPVKRRKGSMFCIGQQERGVWRIAGNTAYHLDQEQWGQVMQWLIGNGVMPYIEISPGGAGPAAFDRILSAMVGAPQRALAKAGEREVFYPAADIEMLRRHGLVLGDGLEALSAAENYLGRHETLGTGPLGSDDE